MKTEYQKGYEEATKDLYEIINQLIIQNTVSGKISAKHFTTEVEMEAFPSLPKYPVVN